MVRLRLKRRGRKKRPYYHVVAADKRAARDGRIIEDLGKYNPVVTPKEFIVNEERVLYWLKNGAQPSATVKTLLRKEGIMYKFHLMNWGKSDEEIEAALEEWRANQADRTEDTSSAKEKQQAQIEAEEKAYKEALAKKAKEEAEKRAKKEAEEKAAKEAAAKEAEEADKKAEAVESSEEQTAKAEDSKNELTEDNDTKEVKAEAATDDTAEAAKADEAETENEKEAKKSS